MRTRGVTRRDFLLRGATAAAGLSFGQALAGPAQSAEAQAWPAATLVQGIDDDTPEGLLKLALEGIGGITRFVQPGQTVCIKPNCTWDYPPHTASSTDPDLLRALILLVREAGVKRIVVLDHPTISSAAECLKTSGIGQVLQELNVEQVFPDRTLAPPDTYTLIDLPKGKAFRKIAVIKAAVETDVRINMAVAKSHVVLPVTLCLKHMMGFLENPPGLHAGLEQGLVDINGESVIHADLHILEAIRVRLRGMAAGRGTEVTDPTKVKRFNQVLAGTDPVLMDSYAVINFFGRQPKEIRYIRMAGEQGLGETDVAKATAEGRLRVVQTAGRAAAPGATQAPAMVTPAPASPTAAPSATASPSPSPTKIMPSPGPTARPTGGTAAAPVGPASPTATALPTNTARPTSTPSPTPTPTNTAVPPTNTPLPTATLDPLAGTAQPILSALAGPATGQAACPTEVVNPNAFLSSALIPVAAIVAGTGLVVRRRLRHREEPAAIAGQQDAQSPQAPSDSGQPDADQGEAHGG